MMRRSQRGEVLVAPEIPLDLLIEIVNRLPIKSLARFKCVSKLWFSIISSKGYLFASSPRLYISSVVENKFEVLSFSLAPSSRSSTVFDLDSSKQGIRGYNMVALRGLILCFDSNQACIYNPTTGQRVTLPAIKSNILAEEEEEDMVKLDVYFFGYDPVLDQYKVLCSAMVWLVERQMRSEPQHWVFVLEAGSSWKRIECDHPHFPTRRRLCINGIIYYFAIISDVSVVKFMSFDVRSEEFSMIQLPEVVSEYGKYSGLELIEYAEKPTIFDYTHLWNSSGLVNLWVLEDAGKWSKKSLVLQPCQMHLFPSSIYFEVFGTTQNGEVILKPEEMSSTYYILYYNLHKNDVRRVDIRGISRHKSISDLALMDRGESIMHLKI